MARVLFVVALLSFVSVLSGASSKDATYTESTAVVVRAHPWLTRGLARESLIGIRFWGVQGAWGGGLDTITFRLRLENCARDQLGDIKLWRMDFNNYGFYEPNAIRLDGVHGTLVEAGQDGTYTFTFTGDGSDAAGRPDWFYPHTPGRVESDYLWLTAEIDPAISRDARIYADVVDASVSIGGCTYVVDNNLLADGSVAPHRVYPYKYRVNAYLRDDRMANAAGRARDVFSGDGTPEGEAREARLRVSNLTELTLIDVFPIYNAQTDTFELSWDRKRERNYRVDDTLGLKRLKGFRDAYHPEARVHISLTKDGWPYGSDARVNEHTLDSMNTGTAFRASVLGHAVGDKYRLDFVDAVVALMEAQEIDGLDVDWEYPNTIRNVGIVENDEFRKYGRFLRDLAEAFFNHGWELAMCTNLGYQMPTGNDTALFAVPDFINSMAYGGSPLNASNQVMSTAVNLLTSRGVPKRRIVVGQAMFSNTSYHLGWDEIVSRLRNDQSKDYFSRLDSDTYWEAWGSGSYHTYTGPTTYRAKCNRARMEGYGGVMSWGYYSDTRWGTDDLLCLGQNQAQAVWPHDYRWPTPPQAADGSYLLDSEEDWFWFQENPDNSVRLAADIVFTHDPLPIETFSRTLDGAGHTLTLPKGVWLCTFDDTALFRTLSGTVKDLTVVLEGRAVTRNDRKNDTAAGNTSLTLPGNGRAALLAASLTGNASLTGVTLRLAEGAEIQGAKQAGLLAANAWTDQSPGIALTRVRADLAGIVRNLADNTGDCLLDGTTDAEGNRFNTLTQHTCAGGLIGWAGAPSGAVALADCAVALAPTARVANDTGYDDAAGGAVGHVNTAAVRLDGLDVAWHAGAEIAAKAPADNASAGASPWAACYSDGIVPGVAAGRILVPYAERAAFRAAWPTYWLEGVAPLWFPGYRLRLR